jgi:methyl-accepting chemotaxis protein
VVATEVKELAQGTAKATEDVSLRIQAIQADSTQAVEAVEAVEAIAQIGQAVDQINALQATIAESLACRAEELEEQVAPFTV